MLEFRVFFFEFHNFWGVEVFITQLMNARKPLNPWTVLCLSFVTFEEGVAWLTGGYSMAVRPIEEHLCDLYRKWKPDYVD